MEINHALLVILEHYVNNVIYIILEVMDLFQLVHLISVIHVLKLNII